MQEIGVAIRIFVLYRWMYLRNRIFPGIYLIELLKLYLTESTQLTGIFSFNQLKMMPISRVVYVFGKVLTREIEDLTVTHINGGTLQQLRMADKIVNDVLRGMDENGKPNPNLKDIMMDIQQVNFDIKAFFE